MYPSRLHREAQGQWPLSHVPEDGTETEAGELAHRHIARKQTWGQSRWLLAGE